MPTTFIFFIAVSLICHWAGADFSKKSKNYGDVPQALEPTIYQPTPRTARMGPSPRIELVLCLLASLLIGCLG